MRTTALTMVGLAASCLTTVPVAAQAPSLGLTEPTVIYNASDGLIALTGRTVLSVNEANRVFVVDPLDGGVYVIDPGARPRRLGRKGSGPGEFRDPEAIGWIGDTLWVSDAGNLSVTFFPRFGDGRAHTRSFAISPPPHSMPQGLTSAGNAIVFGRVSAGAQRGTIQSVPVWIVHATGTPVLDTLARVERQNTSLTVRVRASKAFYQVSQPFSDATSLNLSSNGAFYVELQRAAQGVLHRGLIMTLKRTDGSLLFRRALPASDVQLPDREFDLEFAKLVKRLNGEGKRLGFGAVDESALRRDMYRPAYRLAASSVHVFDDGRVLVRGNDLGVERVRYSLYSVQGTLLGIFHVPMVQRVMSIVGDYCWSLIERDTGELEIVRQRIVWPR